MNKTELVEEVASQTGLAKKASREAVDAVVETITNMLKKGGIRNG